MLVGVAGFFQRVSVCLHLSRALPPSEGDNNSNLCDILNNFVCSYTLFIHNDAAYQSIRV